MEKRRGKIGVSGLMLILLSLIFVYSSSTFLRSHYNFYVAFASYLCFFFLSVGIGQKWRINKTYTWALLALVACPIYALNGAGSRITTYLSGIIYLFFWYNAFMYLADNYDRKIIKRFAVINLCILITNIVTTISVLELYPLAARAINGRAEGITDRDIAMYTEMGCGGFGFIYGAVFMSLGIATAFRSKEITPKTKVFSIVFFVLLFAMILAAQFTTALLLTVIMLLFCLIMNSKNFAINITVTSIICVFVVIFGDKILSGIHALATSMNIDYLADKMDLVLNASDSESIDSLDRIQKYMESLKGFAKNPILGTGGSGGHSQILDTFSTVGLFAIPYLMLLFSIFKGMSIYIDRKYVFIFGMGVLILATLNPFVDSTIISLSFMMTPILLYCFVPKNNNQLSLNNQ